jgi:hypothetical protein
MKKYPGVLIGVAVAVLLSAGVTSASSSTQINYTAVGSLDYVWTGVPSRGCAAVGLCGVAGSLQVNPDGSSDSGSGPPMTDVTDDNAVVRVEYPSVGGAPERVCADPMPYDVQFALARGDGLRTGDAQPNNPTSAGECAGPSAGDLGGVRLPVRREANGNYDLSGRVSLGAGPFALTVISKLRVVVSRQHNSAFFRNPSSSSQGRIPKARWALQEQASVYYRIPDISGATVAEFKASPPPLCEALAACGATGSVRMAISRIGQQLALTGYRIVRHRVSGVRALSDLRAGRLTLGDDSYQLDPSGTLSESVSGPGSVTCTDTLVHPYLDFSSSPTRAGDRLLLDSNGNQYFEPEGDPLRTYCAGPGSATILGSGAIGTGVVQASEIGAPRIELVLRNPGAFDGNGYSGVRGGAITLTLVRRRMMAGTVRVKVYGNPVQ